MAHTRRLGLLGIGLTKARVRHTLPALIAIRDEIEPLLIQSEWFPKAPFGTVCLAIRYGLEMQGEPTFSRINKKYDELPLAIEIDTQILLEMRKSPELVKEFLESVVINALLCVGRRYKLPTGILESLSEPGLESDGAPN